MGWQFAAAEFVGGPIMIVLLARRLVSAAPTTAARGCAGTRPPAATTTRHGGGQHDRRAGSTPTVARQLRPEAAWADAAGYTMADLKMLRRELVVGYVIAGFLAVAGPHACWNDVFLHGHGVWTSVENVVVGPFIADHQLRLLGRQRALAAALWKGGISFGGVIAFIFADLITLPLLLIYRKYYGSRLTLRLLGCSGRSCRRRPDRGTVRHAAGFIPHTRPASIVRDQLPWNYTTI